METPVKKSESLDDVVFENRNKDYGAFVARKAYKKDMTVACITSLSVLLLFFLCSFIIVNQEEEKLVLGNGDIIFVTTKLATDEVLPPPLPPPPPPARSIAAALTVFKVVDKPVEEEPIPVTDPGSLPSTPIDTTTVAQLPTDPVGPVAPDPVDPPIRVPEEMPVFPGGEGELLKYIKEHTIYPKEALGEGISGKVYVEFVISEKGFVTNIKLARGVHPELDAEALRVIATLPQWEPGKQGGTPVKVILTIPIVFTIAKD